MYICIYVYTYARVHIYIYICVWIYIRMCGNGIRHAVTDSEMCAVTLWCSAGATLRPPGRHIRLCKLSCEYSCLCAYVSSGVFVGQSIRCYFQFCSNTSHKSCQAAMAAADGTYATSQREPPSRSCHHHQILAPPPPKQDHCLPYLHAFVKHEF